MHWDLINVAHIADALESRVQNGGSGPALEAVINGLSDRPNASSIARR